VLTPQRPHTASPRTSSAVTRGGGTAAIIVRIDNPAMSANRERRLFRERRDHPSTSSMDDWYVDVCKRNVNKLSVLEQPSVSRPRAGSFKYSVKFVTGKWSALLASCHKRLTLVVLREVGMHF